MIGYLEGRVMRVEAEGILLLAGQIGFEILLNATTIQQIMGRSQEDETIALYIYYHVTERQPKPILIGFASLEDRAFFQLFITVAAIGPMKAVKALTRPTGEIALAIEQKDVSFLSQLSGIGKRTAEKIIATLHGKVEGFVTRVSEKDTPAREPISSSLQEVAGQVEVVLVEQLGHSTASARRMINEALARNQEISTPEDLFDEIYRENQ
ncbi:Holliday junction branch migration protein RuvA [Desulfospira joergensenii]|uniref:Holliday junction branch migration protein RuvA n=1 Tax=Desulfospira joergensenii TaxID=53329 RepID=UPI0003B5CC1F|nr:Holliday junction branch migration protein RuvA [Desulfospira joergensenii]